MIINKQNKNSHGMKKALYILTILTTLVAVHGTAAAFDVSLTKTLLTMPGQGYFTNDDVPLDGARYLSGGYFVVASYCSGKSGSNKKGLWVFTTSGSLVGTRDACRDAGEDGNGSTAHAWGVVPNTQPTGAMTFVKEMGPNNDRPPLSYEVSAGGVDFVSRAWTAPGPGGRSGSGSGGVENVAAIPGYAVAVEDGDDVLYSLPNWSKLDDMTQRFIPITGVGNFIVGTPSPGNGDLVVYKVSHNNLQFVGKKDTNIRPVAATIDAASNGTKVGFLFINDGSKGNHVDVYSVSDSGLALAKTVKLPSTATFASTGWQGALAISGNYTAFVDCGLPALPLPPNGANDFSNAAKCGLAVMNGSTTLSVERLPYATTIGASSSATPEQTLPPALNGIAITPSGAILATSFYGAYLYQIGGASTGIPTGPTVPGTIPTGLGTGLSAGSVQDNLNIARGYLLLLQALFGGQTAAQKSAPVSNQYQGVFDQALQLINLYGTQQ